MPALPLVIAPDPVLKAVARPVAAVDARIRTLMDDMLDTMYDAQGIGLAANQIGLLDRVIVMDVAEEGQPRRPLKMANPEITAASDAREVGNEGCLSLPEFYGDIERHKQVTVRYLDETGTTKSLDADGLLAVCIQHEIDHLNGVLFVDHLSALKRGMILRKLQKLKRNG